MDRRPADHEECGQTTFFIPSDLAYATGHGRRHRRQLHLVFKVELLEVEKAD